MLPRNKYLNKYSSKLRKNMTDAERKLWSLIRRKQIKGYQFYRQKVIGNYIVDFYCHKAKLIIEVDGGQHYREEGMEADRKRDSYFRGQGLKILRFSNIDVLRNSEGVLEVIYDNV